MLGHIRAPARMIVHRSRRLLGEDLIVRIAGSSSNWRNTVNMTCLPDTANVLTSTLVVFGRGFDGGFGNTWLAIDVQAVLESAASAVAGTGALDQR